MKVKRLIFLVIGFICLGLGAIGVVLPILPTVPFFLATVVCFANSSQKLHSWFVGTRLYQNNVEPFLQKKGMTIKAKLCVMISMTVLMGIGFLMMEQVPVGRIILAMVWFAHMIYFSSFVKTMA